ncbi:LysR family transcriptional regulator [Naumannella cuiyingiana]|uniref:DNA-binding transcriptional LysR family regulator n=1 Tax=Naumannella cuiyingiana TaxID=1347891 RepID=A0A7Z0D7P3_9ACTN|nr:LysR family transcriptional regulator [Naumannella cuiyingiana]NYI70418.1 DNA-binding transcriptional LysR family regulator [Naumannella cuiyingiana]
MSATPSVDDLRLIASIAETGSIGAAARMLRIAQPSASQRLARIERRCGALLFTRDATGASATAAGAELAALANRVLGELDGAYAAALGAAADRRPRIGAIAAMAPSVIPSFESLLGRPITPLVDHGPRLIELVAEECLDAAIVAIADQVTLPRRVISHRLGEDRLVLLRAAGTPPPGRGRRAYRGHRVVHSTYDRMGPVVQERLIGLGADAEPGATLPTTLAMVRWRGCLGVVPRSALAHDLHEGEVISELPFAARVRVSLITGREPGDELRGLLADLGRWLHLTN